MLFDWEFHKNVQFLGGNVILPTSDILCYNVMTTERIYLRFILSWYSLFKIHFEDLHVSRQRHNSFLMLISSRYSRPTFGPMSVAISYYVMHKRKVRLFHQITWLGGPR